MDGTEFSCPDGEVFLVANSGGVHIRGTQSRLTKDVQAMSSLMDADLIGIARFAWTSAKPLRWPAIDKRVFVIHGHDIAARNELELLLRKLRMEPIVLMNLSAEGDTIIERLEHYLRDNENLGFACVLLTPDDEGHAAGHCEDKLPRARQNVILELGMVLGCLGRSRVSILHKGPVELPSDISGLIYHQFRERVDEVKTQLFHDLRNAGYDPDLHGL